MKFRKLVSMILTIVIFGSVFAGLSVSAEDIKHTYTVVGDADFLSEKWNPAATADDLTLQVDGTYKITYTNVAKSDCYTVKVAEDHAWDNCFGPALGDDSNIEFSVPQNNSTVDIIFTLQGTKEKEIGGVLTTVNDGYVTVLVNGALAPGKVIPVVTEHYDKYDNPNYPQGTTSFNNMIYIVDVNNVSYNELSKTPTYGGEWRYLHADGSFDYTPGTIYEPKGISVTIDKTDVTLNNGDSTTVKAIVKGGDLGYTTEWVSSNEKVAVVDQNGKITAKGKGTADVTVKVQNPGSETDVFVATVKVTVTQPVTSVEVSPVTVYTGKTTKINFTVSPSNANNKAVSYTSSNKSVATVTSEGIVKGVKPGIAYITLKALDGSNTFATCKVTVMEEEKQNQTISLSKTSYTKTYGDKPFNLNASAKTSLQYKSSNTKVATVSSNGTVTIKGSGSATITITALSDEQYNSAVKTVKITVNKATQTITAKSFTKTYGSKAFSLGVKSSGDGKLTYSSSDKKVATVSTKGVVTVKGCGKVTITINASTTSRYKSASKKVYITVLPSNVQITSLTGKGNTAKMTFKKQQGLSGYVVEISRKSNFSFKASNILKGNREDCSFNGCLAGKKYYVRIKAFVKIGSKTHYSKWSTRSVIIKR